ncbi:aminotransferase DegT [bacterium]|nr:aminotransferase DegT [bacterium]|tara:strand:+ start:3369 stop:4424 length:1056 start_codon:yes stop_codon:yes gene_type:complete
MIALSKPVIGNEEKKAVMRVLDSGMIAQGPEVEAFENEFSLLMEGHHCIAVNSGTSALHLGLLASGIECGHEVIIPSFTFAATANAVSLCGATPVFVDIDINTFTMDPIAVEAAITKNTSAIMPVHLYGHPAHMDPLTEICAKNGLMLLEDAAQAHLATYKSQPVGTFGTAAFSFYPTKNMTSGEGGMIVTADDEIARKARLLRNQGMEKRYQNEVIGFNNRMTDIHAAIGRVQLQKLRERTTKRQQNAIFLSENLSAVTVPTESNEVDHVYHQYTIKTDMRNELSDHLTQLNIGNGVYYPTPVHELPSFGKEINLPNTNVATQQALSIPVHPLLTEDQLNTIVEAVNSWR